MERVSALNYCVGLFSLLLLQGALHVEGRSILSPGESCFLLNTSGGKSTMLFMLFSLFTACFWKYCV
uniref:Uncharacterized protein n=1 Tax=Neogobius melanostomus TaxID=47308 RepID=A0A8C6U3X3_9GOBI